VDRKGTRVLNGPDGTGVVRATPTNCCEDDQVDFDPLYPYIASYGKVVKPRVSRNKQVVFDGTIPENMTYQTIALFLPVNDFYTDPRYELRPIYRWDYEKGRLKHANTNSTTWIAKGENDAVGEFEFRLESQILGVRGTLWYVRRYKDAANNPQVSAGSVELPVIPGVQSISSVFGNMGYGGFLEGALFFSSDGLTISGFKVPAANIYNDTYDLKISLADPPILTLSLTDHALSTILESASDINETVSTGPGEGPDVHRYDYVRKVKNSEDMRKSRWQFVDYFNGKLHSWRTEFSTSTVDEYFYEGKTDSVHSSKTGCPYTVTNTISSNEASSVRRINKYTSSLSGVSVQGTTLDIPKNLISIFVTIMLGMPA
jgi:hypothetical protein